MKYFQSYLKRNCQFDNYQIAQLNYFFSTVFSEISKIFILALLFRKHLTAYVFALSVMLFLRCTTGGLHFCHYWSCLAVSMLYLFLGIRVLPNLCLGKIPQAILLFLCLTGCYAIGPVLSGYRPVPTADRYRKLRNITCLTILLYAFFLLLLPCGKLSNIGFWMIVLHTLQLYAAGKIQKRKGE